MARQRCWRYHWVLDRDLKSFFETIDGERLLRAVRRHTDGTGVLRSIERWLKAPVCMPDGPVAERSQGTPQGAVSSPLLATLFLPEAFDQWMAEQHADIPFERYADDIRCPCVSEAPARALQDARGQRLSQWHLERHPHKTTIVYGKGAHRRGRYPEQRFDFRGYTVRPRSSKNATGQLFVSFAPAVSEKAAKAIRQRMRRWRLHQRHDLGLDELARWTRPVVMGWVGYYGRFHASALRCALRTLDDVLVRWAQRKYKRLRAHKGRAGQWVWRVRARQPALFAPWVLASPVGREEPDESRGSRPVLGGPGGEISLGYSTCLSGLQELRFPTPLFRVSAICSLSRVTRVAVCTQRATNDVARTTNLVSVVCPANNGGYSFSMTRGIINGVLARRLIRSGQSILDVAEQLAGQTDRTVCLIHGRFPRLTGVAKNPGVGGQSCHTPTEWFQRRVDLRALESQLVEVVGLAKACVARGEERFEHFLSGLLTMKQAVFEQWGIGSEVMFCGSQISGDLCQPGLYLCGTGWIRRHRATALDARWWPEARRRRGADYRTARVSRPEYRLRHRVPTRG